MWTRQFESRLKGWNDLRTNCLGVDLEPCLQKINRFWMGSPWQPYYLHWDDQKTWPDPWQLLADDIYCDLARSLGIVYTILLLDRIDIGAVEIVETDQGNLVLVQSGKYILNWNPDTIVNNPSTEIKVTRSLDSSKLVHLLG